MNTQRGHSERSPPYVLKLAARRGTWNVRYELVGAIQENMRFSIVSLSYNLADTSFLGCYGSHGYILYYFYLHPLDRGVIIGKITSKI
jgi:hypothetical protein